MLALSVSGPQLERMITMRDPKLAIALAMHEGAMRLIATEMSVHGAVRKSREVMLLVVGIDPADQMTSRAADGTLVRAIEDRFDNR